MSPQDDESAERAPRAEDGASGLPGLPPILTSLSSLVDPEDALDPDEPTELSRRQRFLVPGEQEIFRVRLSAVVLLRPAAWLAGAVLVAGVLGPAAGRLGGFLVLAAVVNLAWRVLRWWDFEVILTDRRLLQIADLPVRREVSLALRKVTDVTYEQTVLGRLARYGHFTMESAGQNQGLGRLRFVADSKAFNRELGQQLFRGSKSSEY